MSLVRTDPHLWCMLVGLSSVTWTLTPFPVGIDKTAVEPLCLPVVVQTSPTCGRFDEITGWL